MPDRSEDPACVSALVVFAVLLEGLVVVPIESVVLLDEHVYEDLVFEDVGVFPDKHAQSQPEDIPFGHTLLVNHS